MAGDSSPIENWVAPDSAVAKRISAHLFQTKISARSIHPQFATASPRHKGLGNPCKQLSAQKSSNRGPAFPKPAPDNRTCRTQTNMFDP